MKLKIILPLIAIVAFLIHVSYLPNGFTWLDHNDIESKQAILPLNQIGKMFGTPFGRTAFYRPLVTLSYSIDFALYGMHAFGFHLTNLLLHIAVAIVSVLFLNSFIKISQKEKMLTVLIVGIHPVSSIIVGSITQRQESLVLIFIMFTVYFHVQYRKKTNWTSGILMSLSYLLALFSKETAFIVIPLLIALWEFIQQKSSQKNKKYFSLIYVIEALISAIYIFLRLRFVPSMWGTKQVALELNEAIATRLSLVIRWLNQLILPIKPGFSDAVSVIVLFHPVSILAIFMIIVSFILLIKFGLKSVYGILFTISLIFIAPGLNIIPVPRVGSPHYSYLPLISFACAVSILVWRSQQRVRKYMVTICVIWIAIASFHTFITGYHFENDVTLFSAEVIQDKNFLEGYQYLGDYYFFRNDLQKAESNYTKSLQKNSKVLAYVDRLSVLNNFAGVRLKQNRLEDANILLSQINNAPLIVIYNRAVIASRLGAHRTVVELLMKHVPQWKQPEPLFLLANSLHVLGRDEDEYTVLKTALPYISDSQQKSVKKYLQDLGKKK